MGAEQERVKGFGGPAVEGSDADDWYSWGPYLSERQWGTVREDYSADGEAWNYLPHDHARSHAYRWGEDGLAGFSDREQRLCLSLALWNGRDPILKERPFGLTGAEANHGEDVKDYWWYLDAVPSHAWNRWRYHYPQAAFPYEDLRAENSRRGKNDPEYELLDTGAFDDDRYWIVEVHYAKADPTDLLMSIHVTNAGPEADTVHVLPTLWFRDTWSWDLGAPTPQLAATAEGSVAVPHPLFGDLELVVAPGPDGTAPALLFCNNETNAQRLYGISPTTSFPKDGINDHVVSGAATVNPELRGTKCAAWYQVEVEPGASVELRLRLRPTGVGPDAEDALGSDFEQVTTTRRAEADEFYAELTPSGASADEAMVMRQAFAGMLWGKQLYNYDVARWLDGDPGMPTPPASRLYGRNSRWRQFNAFDIMSMPDKWEYPWFAAWDLAFHTVALAHVDPAFAKGQLLLLCREWFQHPNGALPAYEWDFGDVNPPVHAWAALEVFTIDGARDFDFLSHHLRQTAGQLHLVGQPPGRRRIEPVRGRLPRARQHRPARPFASTGRRYPGAVRRHGLDGHLRPGHDDDSEAPAARRKAAGTGSDAEVPRTFRHHPGRNRPARDVGRGRRTVLRPDRHIQRRRRAGEGPFDGEHHPPPRGSGHRRTNDQPVRWCAQEVRRVPPTLGVRTTWRSSPSPGSSAASPEIDDCSWVWSVSIG